MPEKIKENAARVSSLEKFGESCLPYLLLLLDYAAVVMAEQLSYVLRRSILPIANAGFVIPHVYLYIIVPTIFLCFLHSSNTHIRSMPFWKMAQNVFWAVLYAILTITMLMYFGKVADVVSRLFVGMTGIFAFTFIITVRYGFKKYINARGLFQIPVLFIGAGRTAELVLKSFAHDAGFGYKVIGFLDDNPISKDLIQEYPLLGKLRDAERIVRETGVQTVIITAPGLSPEHQVELVNRIQPYVKNVSFVPDLIGTPLGTLEVESLMDEKLMLLKVRNNLAHWHNRVMKRCFDLVVSFCGLVVVIPLGILLSILIYIDSPGPVLFAHRRIGQHGREFPCYKFRSMVPNAQEVLNGYLEKNPTAQEEWEQDFKLKHDPRVTYIGAFLRKTSLDELPQLLNVLKGEMSLVGPRPIIRDEIVKYGDYIHDFYLVPPGITGMWQVNGRSDTTYEQRVQMDSWYVRNWSVWIDMMYLLKTVKVVIAGKGAY